jgi:hypothetical protein
MGVTQVLATVEESFTKKSNHRRIGQEQEGIGGRKRESEAAEEDSERIIVE